MALSKEAQAVMARLADVTSIGEELPTYGHITRFYFGPKGNRRVIWRLRVYWSGAQRHVGSFNTRAEAVTIGAMARDERDRGTLWRDFKAAVDRFLEIQQRGTRMPASLAPLQPRRDMSKIKGATLEAKEALRLGDLERVGLALDLALREIDK